VCTARLITRREQDWYITKSTLIREVKEEKNKKETLGDKFYSSYHTCDGGGHAARGRKNGSGRQNIIREHGAPSQLPEEPYASKFSSSISLLLPETYINANRANKLQNLIANLAIVFLQYPTPPENPFYRTLSSTNCSDCTQDYL
jgi:hypothetical protein